MPATLPTDVPARSLRLLNVVSSIDPATGGTSESILRISRAVMDLGHEVETVSVDDPASAWKSMLPLPVHLKGPPRGPLEYSREFNQWLQKNAGRFDAIISHGVWRDNSRATRRAARAAGRPYFVFPHGMLDPWFKRYYPLKHLQKMFLLAADRARRPARCRARFLFTCKEEMILAREYLSPLPLRRARRAAGHGRAAAEYR